MPRQDDRRRTHARLAVVLVLLLVSVGALGAAAAHGAPAAGLRAGGPLAGSLVWPLAGGPPASSGSLDAAVVRRFELPAHAYGSGHRGVDLAAPQGSDLLSPLTGVLSFAGEVAGRPVVTVTAEDGTRATFEPASALVTVGARVVAGQVVATVSGASPNAPPGTVHWGVRGPDGTYLDPVRLSASGRVVLLPVPGPG